MSALPFPPELPTACIVGYFEMKLSLILMYTGFFLYCTLSHTPGQSISVFISLVSVGVSWFVYAKHW